MKPQSAAKLALLVVAFGFLTTAVEVRYLHREVVEERWVAWIPTAASALAFLAGLLGLAGGRTPRMVSGLVFSLVAVAGIVGLYFHTGFRPEAFTKMISPTFGHAPAQNGGIAWEEGERESSSEESEGIGGPPTLAPTSLTGLAVIGLLLLAASKGGSKPTKPASPGTPISA